MGQHNCVCEVCRDESGADRASTWKPFWLQPSFSNFPVRARGPTTELGAAGLRLPMINAVVWRRKPKLVGRRLTNAGNCFDPVLGRYGTKEWRDYLKDQRNAGKEWSKATRKNGMTTEPIRRECARCHRNTVRREMTGPKPRLVIVSRTR